MSDAMAPPLPPLTLVVATTPSLGIGLRGSLPWPPLKSDLAFFARVTKRAPPPSPRIATDWSDGTRTRNAVIMGRKTWESIPPKVRPLKGRINVIVSRNAAGLALPEMKVEGEQETEPGQEMVVGVGSIEEGLRRLRYTYPRDLMEQHLTTKDTDEQYVSSREQIRLGRVFVIGGAEIYKHALEMPSCERILWTRLAGNWHCDVFFPRGVLPTSEGGDTERATGNCDLGMWAKKSAEELAAWTGEDDAGGSRKEGGVDFEFVMLEREKSEPIRTVLLPP